MAVTWYGERIAGRVAAAAIEAVNQTTAAAEREAKQDHWWENHTEHLQQETISEPARLQKGVIVGRFGTTRRRGFYGLFLEYQQPFLRPVADRTFPTLAARLAILLREMRL